MYSAFQLAKKYIKYYVQATSAKGHGVHSPFVFEFIKFVKNGKQSAECFPSIEALRKQMLNDTAEIEVADFGAGSTVLKSNKRLVSKMATSSLKPKKFAQLLFRLVNYYKPKTIVELGTSFGITTSYLACANKNAQVYTLEGSPSIAAKARQNFLNLNAENIELIEGDFNKTLPDLLQKIEQVDLVFVDGNHRKIPTLEYFKQILPFATKESIFIFDDIHWSAEMEEAWEIIKQHEAVTLSIDLFFVGIVWFRKDFMIKQQFSIRF